MVAALASLPQQGREGRRLWRATDAIGAGPAKSGGPCRRAEIFRAGASSPAEPSPVIQTSGAPARARWCMALPGEPASAGVARRAVREALDTADRGRWSEAAELACTEVVSNVVLHAHTDLELTVEVYDEHVRVQVRDFSPALPRQRDYGEQGTTGRGMALVAALAADHGVSDVGPDGKTVWFVVAGDAAELSEPELLAAWQDASWDLGELLGEAVDDVSAEVRTVRLLGLPPLLWLAARQHHDALLRDFALHLAEHGPTSAQIDVPATDRARSTVSSAVVDALEQAGRAGAAPERLPQGHPSPLPAVPATLDLVLTVPVDLGPDFAAMQDTLDAAEELAEYGLLLARPGQPEVIAVRDWVCEQVTAQLAGVAPAPWPGADQERFTLARQLQVRQSSDWDVATVRDAPGGVVAADEGNRIVAVSRSLCDALGWSVEDLVGRRVVTLIPHRLREAHVAGFTRHLTTGEAHVLDVPLTLPVLHADGTEVIASFLVQRTVTDGGRAVYLAWIKPV